MFESVYFYGVTLSLILALFLAVLIGISLGLIGGGGSILTVPVLVYVMQFDTHTATSYSLFIVGVASLVGAVQYAVRKQIDMKSWLYFGVPSLITIYLTRSRLLPMIPQKISLGAWQISSDVLILISLALLVAVVGAVVLAKRKFD